jgi:hypothetical protein
MSHKNNKPASPTRDETPVNYGQEGCIQRFGERGEVVVCSSPVDNQGHIVTPNTGKGQPGAAPVHSQGAKLIPPKGGSGTAPPKNTK